jgi:uncharacterized protein
MSRRCYGVKKLLRSPELCCSRTQNAHLLKCKLRFFVLSRRVLPSLATFFSAMLGENKIPTDTETIIATTQLWLEKAVIGLNLCPFAKAVHVKKQIRYVVSAATTPETLLEELMNELRTLQDADPEKIDTTLLIHPYVLTDFLDFNDFLDTVDLAVVEPEFNDEFQVASLHPHYQFAGTAPDDIENYTNRSPYPTLHLLREESVDRAVAAFPDADQIVDNNIETMKKLAHEGWKRLGLDRL